MNSSKIRERGETQHAPTECSRQLELAISLIAAAKRKAIILPDDILPLVLPYTKAGRLDYTQ
jgi:hypothetical protein